MLNDNTIGEIMKGKHNVLAYGAQRIGRTTTNILTFALKCDRISITERTDIPKRRHRFFGVVG